jgi:lipopolysaccharide/colanic/teichoic acid biosynthesis glycosyltransferase
MVVLEIILAIVGIAALVGVVACIADGMEKKSGGHKPYGPYERFVKRGMDAFLATGALIVLSPIWIITAILIRFKLGSPVLFTQNRPGRNEKVFKLYKFRTMADARDENGELFPDEQRLSAFGRHLRTTSLDELPELLNIIKGEMAIVGPRPLLEQYLPLYNEEQKHRHDVRPGVTGLAQVNGRNGISWCKKLQYDVAYVGHITFLQDVKIIGETVRAVISHDGISSETSVTVEDFDGTN